VGRWSLCALACVAATAHAGVTRMRWRGVGVDGAAPARLEAATQQHLAVALRPSGVTLVPSPPFDAEAWARCAFPTVKLARCDASVVAGELRADRRADIPFRDVEDLAESLALLVSGMLQSEIGDLAPIEEPEEPPMRPTVPAPAPARAPALEGVPAKAPAPAIAKAPAPAIAKAPATATATATTTARSRSRGQALLSIGPSFAIGLASDPTLYGAQLRAFWSAPFFLRAGGTLTLEGTDTTRATYDLSFFRLVAAVRLGAGLTVGRVDVGLTLGPAWLYLHGDAHGASRDLHSFAVVGGPHLAISLTHALALAAGLDVLFSQTDEKVRAGASEIAAFGHWSLDLAFALVYRR
jgi:hypothetical protein